MPTPTQLEVVAHGITAILATWLGLTVATRVRWRPAAAAFSLLCLDLVVWSGAIIVQRLTLDPAVVAPANGLEDVAAFLGPAVTLHVVLGLAVEGHRTRWQSWVLVVAYVLGAVLGVEAALYPAQQFSVVPPHFSLPAIPGEVFGWGWILARLVVFGAAVWTVVLALNSAGIDRGRRRQLSTILVAVIIGVAGGALRILSDVAASEAWVGVSMVTLSMVISAYVVFAEGGFLAQDTVGRAYAYALAAGVMVVVLAMVAIGLESVVERALAVELPLVTVFALVVAVAVFEPVASWLQDRLRGSPADRASDRLLRALGNDALTAQRPERAIEPALARLVRTFRLRGANVADRNGAVIASHGVVTSDPVLGLRLPLRVGGQEVGIITYGAKRNELPITPREAELLTLAAGFVAASLDLAARHEVQAEALTELSVERSEVESRGRDLQQALGTAERAEPGLHVFALGPLRVQRDSQLIEHWGGAKAGSRQAEAIFACLFDRGERGATKDEITELIWPDIDFERADLAFHRTLGGLRTTLADGRGDTSRAGVVTFHHDRYRLNPSIVTWTDVTAFEAHMTAASAAVDPDGALDQLERGRALYRGDYLDDCPFYGDSAPVEERRELLRGRWIDLLLTLGEHYERRGDRAGAAACYRQARQSAGEPLPRVEAALTRLGSPA